MQFERVIEEIEVRGRDLVQKVMVLLREGNVTRIFVKDKRGSTFVEIPATIGIFGLVFTPVYILLGGLLAIATDFRITVERSQSHSSNQNPDVAAKPPVRP